MFQLPFDAFVNHESTIKALKKNNNLIHFILVKAYHNAHKYINKSVYLSYIKVIYSYFTDLHS